VLLFVALADDLVSTEWIVIARSIVIDNISALSALEPRVPGS
jgi:hypothetical protein